MEIVTQHLPYKQGVTGSSPVPPIEDSGRKAVAQSPERVRGANGAMTYARYVVEKLMREGLERRGLPEARLEVEMHQGSSWVVLRARTKQKHLYCPCPGLPKDSRFLVETVEGIIDWLVAEAKQFPDVPKSERVHEISPGQFYVPGITPWSTKREEGDLKILKDKQCKALFEVVCLGQNPGFGLGPTRAERKAAKWAGRVLQEQREKK